MLGVYKSGPATRAMLGAALAGQGHFPVLVARNDKERAAIEAAVRVFSPLENGPAWKGEWAILPRFQPDRSTPDGWARRMAVMYGLSQGGEGPKGLLLTLDNLAPLWPSRDVLAGHHFLLEKGEEMSTQLLLEQAVSWGYTRTTFVTRPGEIAVRGDILDIFAPGFTAPLRLEFFGDFLEDMRVFDSVSQRSQGNLDHALLLPVSPSILTPEYQDQAMQRWKAWAKEGALSPRRHRRLVADLEQGNTAKLWPGLYDPAPSLLESWLPSNAVWLLPGTEALTSALDEALWAWQEHVAQEDDFIEGQEPDQRPDQDPAFRTRNEILAGLDGFRRIGFEDLVMGLERQGVDLEERPIGSFAELAARNEAVPPDTRELEPEQGSDLNEGAVREARDRPWQTLIRLLKKWSLEQGRLTVLCFHSERSRGKFLQLAEQEGVTPRLSCDLGDTGLAAVVSSLDTGADLVWRNTLLLPEAVLQPGSRTRPPKADKSFVGMRSHEGLKPGQLLVHRDYGLGRFDGLVPMEAGGVANDFLLLRFQGDDKLYVPVDRMALVQRFKGPEGQNPALDRLGGVGWIRSREKARKAVEKIARELVEMYAFRKVAKGFSYSPVGELFREFEASFGFEETPDQARAISDVLRDMEKPEPMDRLVCGDVGFGKTEVAMRAAFRAAIDGKQTALLCPTTVLAEQHFQNFRMRFRGFPVQVGMLSRFVPKAKQQAVLKAAARGQVDILIGTHRLLSNDVDLPRLGLLVLDEEQRFGVKHKEKLKEMRKNIDALTLTATPIPRTLQLSLSGVRSLSVIETPPSERKPVMTSLVERDDGVLKQVLAKEIEREGQVFWVHNRVRGLQEVEKYVRKLAPDARVGHAHGQMPERELEETMHKFWHGELDILVCTAIIESGLDFPRANTLVVDQAHMFGLGQLYQLRGRVGRSDRQAYAHFVVRDLESLQEVARKRLKIILDMEYLGAGFQVAMEDLRLRGAGNILGESQSGHIAKVGLDLFLAMLEDEVGRLKGEPVRETTDPELALSLPASIPETYIQDAGERLGYYKGFSSAGREEVRAELAEEVRDRFGPLPEELENFLAVLRLKEVLAALQAIRAEISSTRVKITWPEEAPNLDPGQLITWISKRASRAKLTPPSTLDVALETATHVRQSLESLEQELAQLNTPNTPTQTP